MLLLILLPFHGGRRPFMRHRHACLWAGLAMSHGWAFAIGSSWHIKIPHFKIYSDNIYCNWIIPFIIIEYFCDQHVVVIIVSVPRWPTSLHATPPCSSMASLAVSHGRPFAIGGSWYIRKYFIFKSKVMLYIYYNWIQILSILSDSCWEPNLNLIGIIT